MNLLSHITSGHQYLDCESQTLVHVLVLEHIGEATLARRNYRREVGEFHLQRCGGENCADHKYRVIAREKTGEPRLEGGDAVTMCP
jgi:hypothetical protein